MGLDLLDMRSGTGLESGVWSPWLRGPGMDVMAWRLGLNDEAWRPCHGGPVMEALAWVSWSLGPVRIDLER